MKSIKLLAVLSISLFLSACASLSKEECQTGDWYNIGYTDGLSGLNLKQINEHRQACAEYRITPDLAKYQQGREQGLLQYCTPSNGLQEGLSGNTYANVCPEASRQAFLQQYTQGKAIFNLQSEINRHKSRIVSINNILDENQKKPKLSLSDLENYHHEMISLEVKIEEKQKRLYYIKGKANIPM